jgi:hypothetical protein
MDSLPGTIRVRFLARFREFQVNVIDTVISALAKDFLEERQPGLIAYDLEETNLMLLFLDPHLVKNLVRLTNVQSMETLHHEEILANVSALRIPP